MDFRLRVSFSIGKTAVSKTALLGSSPSTLVGYLHLLYGDHKYGEGCYWYYKLIIIQDTYNMYPFVNGEFKPMEYYTNVSSVLVITHESRYNEVGMEHKVYNFYEFPVTEN